MPRNSKMKDNQQMNENKLIIDKYKYNALQKKISFKDSKHHKKIKKNISKKPFIFALFGLSYYFYFLSLESCLKGEGPCSIDIDWIKKKIIQEIISCAIMIVMTQLILLKKISKYHLIHIIIIFFFFLLPSWIGLCKSWGF